MEPLVAETKVLAVASHVVYGYVGNTMAALVMQALGCDVAALNTVQFSNHTGYKQFKGTRATAEEIADLYAGLKQSYLTDFDVMLSGYAPNPEAVEAVGAIARDLKLKAVTKPGSFFWVLDPVMGDEGRLYVSEKVIPVYKNLLREADLILPNQFEAELLSDTKITSLATLRTAITKLHKENRIAHIIITSIRLPTSPDHMSIIGSTARNSDYSPRIFHVTIPTIDCFFSGTGDMFAALTVVRLREAATTSNLNNVMGWISPDDVPASELPLAKATEKVLGSMHAVLTKTKRARDQELEGLRPTLEREGAVSEKRVGLRHTKAAEVRVVRCLEDMRSPVVECKAVELVDDDDGHGHGNDADHHDHDGNDDEKQVEKHE